LSLADHPSPQQKVALLTKHAKHLVIAPILQDALCVALIHTDAFDTDTLGSFDGTTARTQSAKQCAIKKAKLACELTGASIGLGSEGSFNTEFGLGIIDQEILAYVDIENNIEIIAVAAQPINLAPFTVQSPDELRKKWEQFAPEQAWHLMQDASTHSVMLAKGLVGINALLEVSETHGFPATFSPDFRAMNCPERHSVIALATQDLVHRLKAFCPKCNMPNFVHTQAITGLPCEICATPTSQVKALRALCDYCGHEDVKVSEKIVASAFYCGLCNP
jgi:hypothetical protein